MYLNRLLQEKDSTYCMSYGKNDYYAGNPVIMGRTNYDKGYFNGDIGYVKENQDRGSLFNLPAARSAWKGRILP